MFTLEQVKAAHAAVKSGADFPAYAAKLKGMGVIAYRHDVRDGRIDYIGTDGYLVAGMPKYGPLTIAAAPSAERLKQALNTHQLGQTDYLTFCMQAAGAGVADWLVDLAQMTCSYCGTDGLELLSEEIPA